MPSSSKKSRPAISRGFAEGRYFDLWMVVHTLVGFAGGLSNVFFGLQVRSVYLLGVVLMIVWEIGEYFAGVREAVENRVLDVLVGVLGIFGALQLAARLEPTYERGAFVAAAIAVVFASALGWIAFRRRRRSSP